MMWSVIGVLGGVGVSVGLLQLAGLRHQRGLIASAQRAATGVIWCAIGALALVFWLTLRSFHALTGSVPIAEVRCAWTGHKTFELTLEPLGDAGAVPAQRLQLRGDQWAISGGVVKWHPWLTALGVPAYHKLTRVSGRFLRVEDETAGPPTAYALNGGDDPVWWCFYRLDPYLPFVEAVYGSSAFLTVNPNLVAEVSVTPSGYMIKQKRPRPPAATEPASPKRPESIAF